MKQRDFCSTADNMVNKVSSTLLHFIKNLSAAVSAAESLTNKVNFAFFQPLSGLSDSFKLIVCKIYISDI